MKHDSSHLDALENQSIFILREAYHFFKKLCMPWSMGKDSNVLVWLANKAFFGHVPFPVLHIDTTYEFPEMLEFRDMGEKEIRPRSHREDQRGGARPRRRLRNARSRDRHTRTEIRRTPAGAARIQI